MNFLKKIFSPTILIIFSLLFFYIFYKSEIFWNGDKRSYYSVYYLITIILILFSVVTFFISKKILEYIIIISFSLVFSIYLAEVYLTFKLQFPKKQISKYQISKIKTYEKKTGMKWDKRERLEIYQDLKRFNNEVTISVFPTSYFNKNVKILPLSGISNHKTINCNENGYFSINDIDRYGFNNPDEEWDKKTIEYLLLGDSFTYGDCVNRPNDIASVLRSLSGKSVLNLGQGGNGPLLEYATLREYLNLNVKKILWIYYEGNDLQFLEDEKRNKILSTYLNDLNFTQNLKFKQKEINDLANKYLSEKLQAYANKQDANKQDANKQDANKQDVKKDEKFQIDIVKLIKVHNLRLLIFPSSPPVKEFKKILELTKKLVKKNNSKIYFIYLPEHSHFIKNYDETNYNLVRNIVTELKIPFIDIYKEVIEREQNPLKFFPFELPGHYSVEGYQKTAEIIYKFTKD